MVDPPTSPVRPARPSIPALAIAPPLDATWTWLTERLQHRADTLRDPVAVARLHHQRARILANELHDEGQAVAAWRSGLAAFAGHLPTILALRARALEREDQDLGALVFDRAVEILGRPGTEPGEAAEVAGFFLLVWLFRWPDPPRATRALEALEAAGDPDGLADRLAHVCLAPPRRATRLRRRLESIQDREARAPLAVELAEILLAGPESSDAGELLAQAARYLPRAAWRQVEEAARAGDDGTLASALETLAGICPTLLEN